MQQFEFTDDRNLFLVDGGGGGGGGGGVGIVLTGPSAYFVVKVRPCTGNNNFNIIMRVNKENMYEIGLER